MVERERGGRGEVFQRLVAELARVRCKSLSLAALNDFLAGLEKADFADALGEAPPAELSALDANYVAAMVEHAAHRKGVRPPAWTRSVAPLPRPFFASGLASLRLGLLVGSPPAFRRRNLFVDSTVGDRV